MIAPATPAAQEMLRMKLPAINCSCTEYLLPEAILLALLDQARIHHTNLVLWLKGTLLVHA